MIFLYIFLLWCSVTTQSLAILTEGENAETKQPVTEAIKSDVSKREDPEAQRREHSFNSDGTVNYHGSGSGHDSGDLIPPPGGSVFSSPSIQISTGHTGSTAPGLSNSYGLPIPADSYNPPKNIFNDVKLPNVYKPPVKFGRPNQQYGPPNNKYLPPPKNTYGLPSDYHSSISSLPKPVYGPPNTQFKLPSPPKPVYGPPPISQYGPPKPSFGLPKPIRSKPNLNFRPKPVYGPPKPSFGTTGFSQGTLLSPVTSIKPQYGPPKISTSYGTPLQPSTAYGVPKHPKSGNIKVPPTPPDVKYDGWKPIPGLTSNVPSSSYGVPDSTGHDISGGAHLSGLDIISPPSSISSSSIPPSGAYGVPSFTSTSFDSSGLGIQLKPINSHRPPPKPSSTYGTPLQPSTSYGFPTAVKGSSKGNFLSSLKSPSSSYGLPEPSLLPHPPKITHSYGPPKPPSTSYGVPQISSSYDLPKTLSFSYGPPKSPNNLYGPPKPPSTSYGPPKPPSSSYGPPKPPSSSYGPPKPPSNSYGPPKPPSSSYGPPKPPSSSYGPPKSPSSSYGPPKPPSSSYGPPSLPVTSYGPPAILSTSFTPPKTLSSLYGPPKLSTSYGLPKAPANSYGPPQIFTTYSIPKPGISVSVTPSTAYRGPPVPHPLQPPSAYGAPSFSEGLYKTPLPPDALYGVPTAPAPPTSVGCCGPSLANIGFQGPSSTYGVPSSNIQAPVFQQIPSIEIGLHQPNQVLSTGPSSVLSAPIQSYGTPLLSSPQTSHHPPSITYGEPTALPLRQPKHPVKFRPPVPAGLISSIGAKWGNSAAWGGDAHSHKFHHNTYIPPAVPDPDPGIHANHENPLVIPPPSAPPINYGPPTSSQHHETHYQNSNKFVSSASTSSVEGDLNPPPPVIHEQSSFDIQQSASVEIPSSNNLSQHGAVQESQNHLTSGSVTNYIAPVASTQHHDSTSSVSAVGENQSFNNNVHNIPIKGSQGSYTLQIQAAGGNSGEHIPHGEVLSNGLLQDILAAIENPSASAQLEQYGNQQSNDPVASEIGLNILKQLGGSHTQQSNSIQLPTLYGSDLTHSSSNNVPLYTKTSEANNEVIQIPTVSYVKNDKSSSKNLTEATSKVKISHYLNQNKIALYYNNQEEVQDRKGDAKDILLVQMVLPNNSTNSQTQNRDFEALVSINLQNAQMGVESKNSTIRSTKEQNDDVS